MRLGKVFVASALKQKKLDCKKIIFIRKILKNRMIFCIAEKCQNMFQNANHGILQNKQPER